MNFVVFACINEIPLPLQIKLLKGDGYAISREAKSVADNFALLERKVRASSGCCDLLLFVCYNCCHCCFCAGG